MLANVGFGMELCTLCEVLFGLPTRNNSDLKLTNFIGKWFLKNVPLQRIPGRSPAERNICSAQKISTQFILDTA